MRLLRAIAAAVGLLAAATAVSADSALQEIF